MNTYKTFLIRILILIIFYIFSDFVLGSFLQKQYFSQTFGPNYRTTYSMEKTSAEILIFGSSRANHHYNSKIIYNNSKYTTYNVGRNGMGIIYDYAIMKIIIQRYKPKLIILDFNHDQFYNKEKNSLSTLLPYYNSHNEIKKLVLYRSNLEQLKLVSPSYPYLIFIPSMLRAEFDDKKSENDEYLGYIPLFKKDTITLTRFKIEESKEKINYFLINIFEEFIITCIKNKIKLMVVTSPYLTNDTVNSNSIQIAKDICFRYKIKYLNYSYLKEISTNDHNFSDAGHLSKQGSELFTQIISRNIKNLLDENK